jgi:plastocyanin
MCSKCGLARTLALLLAVLSPSASAPAMAGVIRGHVEVPPMSPSAPRVRDPYVGQASAMPEPRVPSRGEPQDAIVYVEVLPAATNAGIPVPTAVPKLAQQQQSFVPRVVVVSVGGSVEFPNFDPVYHSVFSVSPAKRFDLGRFGKGKSRSVRFLKPGLVNVYCDIHSNMEGFVLVVPNRAVAQADESGSYALPDLPPGRYMLHAWHPDFSPIRHAVEVPENGDLEVDLRFTP